jgi:glycine dehydrogenase subunit 2
VTNERKAEVTGPPTSSQGKLGKNPKAHPPRVAYDVRVLADQSIASDRRSVRTRIQRRHADSWTETPQQRDHARTIFEKGAPGRRAFVCPELDVPEVNPDELLPARLRRAEPPRLPEVSEPEIVRHYVGISKRNFDLDSGFYPLGSCTMKHNPRLHERAAALPGHARLHPLQDPTRAQGALELMWRLQGALAEIAGLPYVSLQPSAGSHGELAGVLLTRAYHESRGETRHRVLTPDTSHGTNPATVTMAGLQVVKLATNPAGGIDLDDLRSKADEDVACLMLTNPNTLGVFDPNIETIAQIVHGVGATLYYDGANLNAVMGVSRPGDMGFDIVHYNLHKSFTQPHGGGGPGSGPIAVSERIAPFLPMPIVVRRGAALGEEANGAAPAQPVFDLDYGGDHDHDHGDGDGDGANGERPGSRSIGRLRGFHGNYGCFVRAYAYICSLGADGLRDASETAVLNANYLLARLREAGVAERLPLAYGELCMHEFVLSGGPMKRELGLKTLDLAKRLLDHGFHPPTVYFPLLVDEALMVEPTETETRETLDAFADAIAAILREAATDGPEVAQNAPYTTPVRRLDEVAAAKRPIVRQAVESV